MMEIRKIEGLPPHLAERIAPHVPDNDWLRLADDIREGYAELFEIDGGDSVAVTRFEVDIDELVVCAYVGREVMEFAEMICKIARKNGAKTLRYHTRRKGMARLLSELGAIETETVYQVTLQ